MALENLEPVTRFEAMLAGADIDPVTRLEYFLKLAATSGFELPAVTDADDGDVLTVVNGSWDKAAPSGGGSVSCEIYEYYHSLGLGSGYVNNDTDIVQAMIDDYSKGVTTDEIRSRLFVSGPCGACLYPGGTPTSNTFNAYIYGDLMGEVSGSLTPIVYERTFSISFAAENPRISYGYAACKNGIDGSTISNSSITCALANHWSATRITYFKKYPSE